MVLRTDRKISGWVSLTFDDALHHHLDHAVPILNEAGFRGTFYTHLSSPAFLQRQKEWIRAAADGHELGNHTVFHPASAHKTWVRTGNAIDYYSLDRMAMELEFANAVLSELDGNTERTFAYPCSNPMIGRAGWMRRVVDAMGCRQTRLAGWVDRMRLNWGSTQQSYEPIIGQLFKAGRGGGLTLNDDVPPTSKWNRTLLPSAAVDDCSIEALQDFVNRAVRAESWAILQFHGVQGGHRLNCPLSTFCDFVAWLKAEHHGRVITVLDGAKRLWAGDAIGRLSNATLPVESPDVAETVLS
jgi:hypothetical protein